MTSIHLATLTIAALLAGCVTTPKDLALVRSGQIKCLEQVATVGDKRQLTRWCTSRQIFQPNRHIITINGQTIFDGNDRDDVRVEKNLPEGTFVATCTPRMDITDMKTDKPVAVSLLPQELVDSCKIVADGKGLHRPFLRDQQCLKVYATHVGPLVGKVFPFKRWQECTIQASGSRVFKGTFYYY